MPTPRKKRAPPLRGAEPPDNETQPPNTGTGFPGDEGPPDEGPPDEGQENPFVPLDDDPLASMIEEHNDPRRVDLRPYQPAPIGGYPSVAPPMGTDLFGGGAPGAYAPPPTQGGRPSSPPIWNSAHLHEAVSQLRVWKRVNGRPVLVGECDSRISTEEFVRRFFAVMPQPSEGEATFSIRPLNYSGIEVGTETELPSISEHHTTLQQERQRRAMAGMPGVGGPMGFGFMQQQAAPVIDLTPITAATERLNTVYESRINQLEDAARAERERATAMQDRVAEERAELAARTAHSVEAVTERLMAEEGRRAERMAAAESERNRAAIEGQAEMFATMSTTQQQAFQQMSLLQQAASERERAANDARLREEADRRERERRDSEERRAREQQEWERKWDREKEENRRRDEQERLARETRDAAAESARQQAHERAMKEMELSQAREREHAERMIRMHTEKEKGESVDGLLNKGIGFLEKFGMKPADLLDVIRPRDVEGPNPLIEIATRVLGDTVKTVGEVVKDRQRQAAAEAAAEAAPPGPPPGYGFPGGFPGQPGQLMLPGPQQYAQPGVPPGYVLVQQQPGQAPVLMPMSALQQPGSAPLAEVPAGYVQTGQPDAPGAIQAVPEEPPAPGCTLPMPTQKTARLAIRNLVRSLRNTPEDQWGVAVAQAVGAEMAIYHYCEQVTIRYAVREGGADDVLAQRIIEAIDASGLVPANIPRG